MPSLTQALENLEVACKAGRLPVTPINRERLAAICEQDDKRLKAAFVPGPYTPDRIGWGGYNDEA